MFSFISSPFGPSVVIAEGVCVFLRPGPKPGPVSSWDSDLLQNHVPEADYSAGRACSHLDNNRKLENKTHSGATLQSEQEPEPIVSRVSPQTVQLLQTWRSSVARSATWWKQELDYKNNPLHISCLSWETATYSCFLLGLVVLNAGSFWLQTNSSVINHTDGVIILIINAVCASGQVFW